MSLLLQQILYLFANQNLAEAVPVEENIIHNGLLTSGGLQVDHYGCLIFLMFSLRFIFISNVDGDQ
jgi:hypothetical protein